MLAAVAEFARHAVMCLVKSLDDVILVHHDVYDSQLWLFFLKA